MPPMEDMPILWDWYQVPQAGLIAVRCLPQAASVFSPGLVVEEHDMLFDRVAPDVQFVGQEVWVGIADGQAAYDRELRRDAQLGSDDVGISRHRNFHAGDAPAERLSKSLYAARRGWGKS